MSGLYHVQGFSGLHHAHVCNDSQAYIMPMFVMVLKPMSCPCFTRVLRLISSPCLQGLTIVCHVHVYKSSNDYSISSPCLQGFSYLRAYTMPFLHLCQVLRLISCPCLQYKVLRLVSCPCLQGPQAYLMPMFT